MTHAPITRPTIAVVHERFTERGGSEIVAEHLTRLAERWHGHVRVHAPLVDGDALPPGLLRYGIRTRRIGRLRRPNGGYAHLLPLLGRAFASYELEGSDLVLVSHHAFAQRVRVPDNVPMVSYVHTPARWIWDPAKLDGEGGALGSAVLRAFATTQRSIDRDAARRPDVLVANSTAVAQRIERFWQREATVVHPPVDTGFHRPDPRVEREGFVLYAGRVVPYKRPDVAVAAADRAGVPIVVAGEGRAVERCREVAGPGATFLGRVDDDVLRDLYRRCAALVLPGEEDFGIVPVEAAACGAPVIGLAAGGTLDTVRHGSTGLLVDVAPEAPFAETVDAFAEAIASLGETRFDPCDSRAWAERFSAERFLERMGDVCATVSPAVPTTTVAA